MSLWDDITEKVGTGSKIVADKAKEVSEIANLRAQIISCDNTLVKNYKELGKAYFEAHKDEVSGEFDDIMKIIKEASDKKASLNEQLADRRNSSKADTDIVDTATDVAEDVAEAASDAVDSVKEAVEDITE